MGKRCLMRIDNKCGVPGVSYWATRDRWRAQITVDGKTIYLPCDGTLEDAIRVRKKAEENYFKEE